jgi:hypothetical protein
MMKETFNRRFDELSEDTKNIVFSRPDEYGMSHPVDERWRGWASSVQNLLRAVYGESSPHYANFVSAYQQCGGGRGGVEALFHLFASARDDFKGGYVFDVELRVSGEVFGDFVALARQLLSDGQKDVAAVLACAALEDALKRYATVNGLSVDGKTMADVVNALKSAALVGGAQKTLLDAMPRIRNMAMHGEWAKISEPDVASVLGFVERFLLSKFSD